MVNPGVALSDKNWYRWEGPFHSISKTLVSSNHSFIYVNYYNKLIQSKLNKYGDIISYFPSLIQLLSYRFMYDCVMWKTFQFISRWRIVYDTENNVHNSHIHINYFVQTFSILLKTGWKHICWYIWGGGSSYSRASAPSPGYGPA